ncbi:hypothetical protein PROVRETT_07236 [Providencia rettgeri DSM 1131]|nr:hypothetical protein PROVRETT_07236 [Providencia rettgeri DSM 1131]
MNNSVFFIIKASLAYYSIYHSLLNLNYSLLSYVLLIFTIRCH